jgi:hypothetical protein
MIRFLPDTWFDALLRPLALASPDGGVYIEFIAPDFRFVFVLVLALMWLLIRRGNERRRSPALVLLGLTAVAFVPWLVTSGNGRYFIPFLLIAGPLCIGLLYLVPLTRSFKLAVAIGMVLWQAFLIYDISPWRSWGHVIWGDGPPFDVEVPKDVAEKPATYVTLSSISYSLIAPRFHPASHWINISSQAGLTDKSPDGLRTQALIAAPGPLRVLFPTLSGGQVGAGIDPTLARTIDDLLARQGLSIEDAAQCRLLRSAGLAAMASSRLSDAQTTTPGVHGFWLCPLARHASGRSVSTTPVPERTERAFDRLEGICPRIFRPGETVSLHIPSGALRSYPGSDFKLYVLDNGQVWYKYLRALNPVLIGNIDAILKPDFVMDCNHIIGRSGLPWERGI